MSKADTNGKRGALVITGGSRGIGAASARLAAAAGWPVVISYRSNVSEATHVVESIEAAGGKAVAIQADVSKPEDIVRLFAEAEAAMGSIGGLVNSAGIGAKMAGKDADPAQLKALLDTNILGTMLCCSEALKRMCEAGRGVIVNISSMAATTGGRPLSAHYAASKAAVDVYTMGVAREVAGSGVRINTVRPGVTATDMVARVTENPELRRQVESTIPIGRLAHPDEVARAVIWLLSDEASFVTGARLDVSGGGFVIGA